MKQKRLLALASAALLYGAILSGIGVYLLLHKETTIQRRLAMTPQATISLFSAEEITKEIIEDIHQDDVPDSWKNGHVADLQDEEKPVPSQVQAEEEIVSDPPPEQIDASGIDENIKPDIQPDILEQDMRDTLPPKAPETVHAEADNSEADNTPTQEQELSIPVWRQYARPFNMDDKRPRIALVVTDLGLAQKTSETAIKELPAEINLAFSPLSADVGKWVAEARRAGHEVLLTIPMEPNNYPQNDPGPDALLSSLEHVDNINRLNRMLNQADGFVGITPFMGDKFVTSEEKMSPIMQLLREKELLVLDHSLSGSSVVAPLSRLGKMPFASADLKIDAASNMATVDTQLADLEKLAQERGHAVGLVLPYPVTFERLKIWAEALDKKDIVLAPLTAVVTLSPGAVYTDSDTPATE